MNPLTYCQWCVDGLGGVVNMIEATARDENVRPSEGQADRLETLIDRLMEAHQQWKSKATG